LVGFPVQMCRCAADWRAAAVSHRIASFQAL
jgi:hypothetical protein